ncbi:hypothetical protein J1N35_002190 [Gossypium stocksii]|uniref:Uncharacterized protein n=1 Tax=Gossypium stocksii TaxID=47602 RepID=A0A9D3WJ57_9ROSI|nr:hypothetical protein J1N35_002190 [Gossypium stocksii]
MSSMLDDYIDEAKEFYSCLRDQDNVGRLLGVQVSTSLEKYLGLPMMVGKRKKNDLGENMVACTYPHFGVVDVFTENKGMCIGSYLCPGAQVPIDTGGK